MTGLRAFVLFAAFALLPPVLPAFASPEGEELFVKHRCVRCHTVGRGRFAGPDLKGVFDRHSREAVLRWITDPSAVYAAEGRMPVNEGYPPMPPTGVGSRDAEILADYLFSLKDAPPPPPDGGVISGKVINRTAEAPAQGVTVSLGSFLGDRLVSSRSEETAAVGGFAFRGLSWSAAHKLSINSNGVAYETAGMVFKPAQNEIEVDLPIYDPSRSDKFVRTELHHLIIEPFEGGARVVEFLELSNTGKTAFISSGAGALAGVPAGAESVRVVHGAGGGDSFTLLPGASRVALSYTVPARGASAAFAKKLQYKTESFVVVSPETGGIAVEGLGEGGRVSGDGGEDLFRWSGEGLPKGKRISVSVRSSRESRPAWVLPFAVFALVIAGAVLFGRVWKRG